MADLTCEFNDMFPTPAADEREGIQWFKDRGVNILEQLGKFLDHDQTEKCADIDLYGRDRDKAAAEILARTETEYLFSQMDRPQDPATVSAPVTAPSATKPFGSFERKIEAPVAGVITPTPAGAVYDKISRQDAAKQEQQKPAVVKPAVKSVATAGKTKQIVVLVVVVVALIGVAIVFIAAFLGDDESAKQKTSENAKKLLEESKTYNSQDIRGMRERKQPVAPQDNPLPATTQEPAQPAPQAAVSPQPKLTKGANYQKDRDIIEQYKEVNPGAAAAEGTAPAASGEGNSLRYRPRPFSAGSTGDNKGGIHITGRDTGPQKNSTIQLHNTTLKARLKFSIRSSASNSITAESSQDLEGIPAGSIFYGSGSFSNKRTYVQFSRVRIGETEYDVKAYAISGKDPGIASEVIEIENNAKITFTSGVMDATGKVLDNLASTATGGATGGIINNTTGEVKDKNEQERARYEYRVGAGTTFTIYIE